MNHLIRILPLALLLLFAFVAKAEVFVVTSNQDDGPGTLREALKKAADNGDAETDHIHFNLPGPGIAARTIILKTRLPRINSSMIIDGSTQPGEALSVNGAKVIITADMPEMEEQGGYAYDKIALSLTGQFQRFEIYGMIIREVASYSPEGFFNGGVAMGVNAKIQSLRIGARGKGNVIYNCARSVVVSTDYEKNSYAQLVELKNNYIGVDERGKYIDWRIQSEIDLRYTANLTLGGSEDEGNIILAKTTHTPVGDIDGVMSTDCTIRVSYNRFFMDAFGENPYDFWYKLNTYFSTGGTRHPTNANTTIIMTDNEFGGSVGIGGFLNATTTLQRNVFGATKDGSKTVPIYLNAVMLSYLSGRTLIGGEKPEDGNLFTNILYHDYSGFKAVVYSLEAHNVELSHNSMFCNTLAPFKIDNERSVWRLIHDVDLTMDEVTASSVSGTATKPGSRIELFYTDKECESCQPKTYFATAIANGQGRWRYDGPIDPDKNVMAAATYQRQSSEFTTPQVYYFEPPTVVRHVTCDGILGSLSGATVKHANKIEWIDEAGEVVGTNIDVDGLQAGRYILRINQFGCIHQDTLIIQNLIPEVIRVEFEHATCNGLGSIRPSTNLSNAEFAWFDEDGNSVSRNWELRDVLPGKYWYEVSNYHGCTKRFGPFELLDQGGTPITVDDSQLISRPASCGSPNSGSITGLKITGATEYLWYNAAGTIVGTAEELHDVPADMYRLVLSNGPCQHGTSYYFVEEAPPTRYPDYSTQITPAHCEQPNGSIRIDLGTGLRPTTLRWLDASGRVVGTDAQLSGLAPGTYTLMLTDAAGCEVEYDRYTVDRTPSLTLNTAAFNSANDACGHGTGSITGLLAAGGRPPYRYGWTNESGATVSQAADATALTTGRYRLTVTDANGCQVTSAFYTIQNTDGALAPPSAPEQMTLCTPGNVSIPYSGEANHRYRLYTAPQGGIALSEHSGIAPFVVHPEQTTTYYLSAVDGSCESPRVPVRIEISNAGIRPPNAFSPNGDGQYDTWRVAGLDSYPNARVSIFNRNGQLIFAQRSGQPDFDGRYKGNDLPIGAYFYLIDLGMGCDPLKGSLNLLR